MWLRFAPRTWPYRRVRTTMNNYSELDGHIPTTVSKTARPPTLSGNDFMISANSLTPPTLTGKQFSEPLKTAWPPYTPRGNDFWSSKKQLDPPTLIGKRYLTLENLLDPGHGVAWPGSWDLKFTKIRQVKINQPTGLRRSPAENTSNCTASSGFKE